MTKCSWIEIEILFRFNCKDQSAWGQSKIHVAGHTFCGGTESPAVVIQLIRSAPQLKRKISDNKHWTMKRQKVIKCVGKIILAYPCFLFQRGILTSPCSTLSWTTSVRQIFIVAGLIIEHGVMRLTLLRVEFYNHQTYQTNGWNHVQ